MFNCFIISVQERWLPLTTSQTCPAYPGTSIFEDLPDSGRSFPLFMASPLLAFVLSLLDQICLYLIHPRLPSGTTEFFLQVQILPGKATLFLEAAGSSSRGQPEQAQRAEALVHRDTVPAERNFKKWGRLGIFKHIKPVQSCTGSLVSTSKSQIPPTL